MENKFTEEQRYLKAKKRVKEIKGFYAHFIVYILVNIFLSSIIIFGKMHDGTESFFEVINDFGVYSTWIFWGIGVFFHWLGVFGVGNVVSKSWEERKIKEIMQQEEEKNKRLFNK
ncbi:2TM domain-containing protein [Tenacibaculum sp. M341]|uniref:2TM domain-containing protein n=1 Tax=Tenacibaculum sp. M341 TaxID=2530339 RepID=UPI001052C35E|nr:2TM domain-containing protein [Tenacibaculum sp. M341]TCI90564.1 2TM domain-containing protein [Tenacibaculum sp. M341]